MEISKVAIYEDNARNVFGLIYDKAGNLVNAVRGLDVQQPLPMSALVTAARDGFPFAPVYDPATYGGVALDQLATNLASYDHHIADIWASDPTSLYPEKATPAGLQFLIRWCF